MKIESGMRGVTRKPLGRLIILEWTSEVLASDATRCRAWPLPLTTRAEIGGNRAMSVSANFDDEIAHTERPRGSGSSMD